MVKIYRIEEHNEYSKLLNDFLQGFFVNESIKDKSKKDIKKILKKVKKDLNINFNIIGVYGAGITSLYTLVETFLSDLKIELNTESIVLATICSLTIIYMEEKKNDKDISDDTKDISNDSKNMLAELKLRGIGNGIIKKIVSIFYTIKKIFKVITKHIDIVIINFVDLFAYTSLLISVLRSIHFVVEKNSISIDNFIDCFSGLAMGIATLTSKHILIEIIDKLKKKINIDKSSIEDIEVVKHKSDNDIVDNDKDKDDMIQEQY